MQEIVTYPQLIGDTAFLPADLFETETHLKEGAVSERLLSLLRDQKKIGPLTPDSFRVAVARRPAGAPWPPRGFTEAYLLESGLIEPETIPAPPPKRKAEKGKPPGQKAVRITQVEITADAIPVGNYFLQPKKSGNFTFFDAVSSTGSLLRDKAFKNVEDGKKFLEGLSGQGQPENSNGGNVQSDPGSADRQDPPADR